MNAVWTANLEDKDWDRVTEEQLDLMCDKLDAFWKALIKEILSETEEVK